MRFNVDCVSIKKVQSDCVLDWCFYPRAFCSLFYIPKITRAPTISKPISKLNQRYRSVQPRPIKPQRPEKYFPRFPRPFPSELHHATKSS